jgi:glycosyltransferase involved in cell wall biosynthesis
MIKTIYNPINQEFIWQLATEKITNQSFLEKQPVIISAGRLGKQKGFDLLINAFSIVRKKLSAKLVILGKGRERQRLKTLIENLGLENDVLLAGFAQNPFKFIARSSVFVSPSFYEGFPNALLEAMALGIPVVSTDCPSGPREIIADGENGLLVLVGDVDALANAILRVLQDKDLAMKLSENGRRRIKDFSIDKIIKQYEDIFLSVANSV